MTLGNIRTGTASSIKMSASDAAKKVDAMMTKATQESNARPIEDNQVKYVTVGEPVFTCFTRNGKKLKFLGGAYFANKDDMDEINALEYHRTMNRLTVETGD